MVVRRELPAVRLGRPPVRRVLALEPPPPVDEIQGRVLLLVQRYPSHDDRVRGVAPIQDPAEVLEVRAPAEHQAALRLADAHHEPSGGGAGDEQESEEQDPEHQHLWAPQHAVGQEQGVRQPREEGERGGDLEQRGRLVQRGLANQVLVTVVEPGDLGREDHEGEEDDEPPEPDPVDPPQLAARSIAAVTTTTVFPRVLISSPPSRTLP